MNPFRFVQGRSSKAASPKGEAYEWAACTFD